MHDSRFTAATKLDANKPPMELLPWEAIQGVAAVLDFGRLKYSENNWRKGFEWCRLAAAALRHIFSWLSGEDLDPESGFSHVDHATCCLMFLSAHIKSSLGRDNRYASDKGQAEIKSGFVPTAGPLTATTIRKAEPAGEAPTLYYVEEQNQAGVWSVGAGPFCSAANAWDYVYSGSPSLRSVQRVVVSGRTAGDTP